jgi:hypothetical protein
MPRLHRWISTTTKVPVDLLTPPLLTGVRTGWLLREGSDDWYFLIFGWWKLHRWHISWHAVHQETFWRPQPWHPLSFGDGKVIILDDSDEEKDVPDEKTTDIELTATSAAVNPASTASVVADDAPAGAKNDNSYDQEPDQEANGDNGNRSGADAP